MECSTIIGTHKNLFFAVRLRGLVTLRLLRLLQMYCKEEIFMLLFVCDNFFNYYNIFMGNLLTFSRDLSISLLLEKYVSGYLKLYKTSAAIQICFTFLILHEKSPTLKETHGQSFRLSMCLIIYCNTECSSCHYLNSTTLLLEYADYSSWRMSIF